MKYLITTIIISIVLIFASCENTSGPSKITENKQDSEQIYITKGQQIAGSTFGTLGGNLQKAMKEGGVANAVKYCNLSASPLVDSLEHFQQAKIKRTSLKTRNLNNAPSKRELKQLEAYAKQVEQGMTLQPVIEELENNQIAFYAPIHVAPLCQKCHGEVGNKLLESDYALIQNLYPNDKAVGYVAGDLRGIWSITMPK